MGAVLPEASGLYFSWGNIDGHPKGGGYNFSADNYAQSPGASLSEDLPLSADAARQIMGDPWRIPTQQDFEELIDNCSSVWTQVNGVYGRLFTSNINGRTIFLPAWGSYNDTTLNFVNQNGRYWSTKIETTQLSYYLQITSNSASAQEHNFRRYGFTIRPVQGGNPNRSIIPPTHEDDKRDEETPTEEPKDNNER